MSTSYTDEAPCWWLHQENDDREWVAHYSTEAEARADRDDDEHLVPRQNTARCARLTCDTCGMSLDTDGELTDHGMHIDPVELDTWVDLCGWMKTGRDVHLCDECPTTPEREEHEEEHERDLSRVPGPDEVPLPLPRLEPITPD